MKKIILLLFVFSFSKNLGQDLYYKIEVLDYSMSSSYSYVGGFSGCNDNTYVWNLGGQNYNSGDVSFSKTSPTFKTTNLTIPARSNYTLTSKGNCNCVQNQATSGICTKNVIQQINQNSSSFNGFLNSNDGINKGITGGYALGPNQGHPFGIIIIQKITPIGITVNRIQTTPVCAGEAIELQALVPSTTQNFPDVAYHWQYSLDNEVTWIDVPNKIVNGVGINDTKVSNFTMYDILGADHINYFRDIYFRIGYPGRPFSANTIRINYTPCTPILTDVNYEDPKCNGDDIQKLELTFDRPLDATRGESLYQLYAKETVNNEAPIKELAMLSVSNITYPSDSKIYSYTNMSQFSSLESGREYEIIYQAQVNHPLDSSIKIPKGVMVSAKKFTYKQPAPLKFEIKKADNPLCTNDLAEVSIAVTGGTGDYKFYVDGVEKTNPKPVKETDGYYHIRGLIPTATNNIKVMDENNCIERTP
jgi:hypothetical protein